MTTLMLVLRFTHIVSGALWVGAMAFATFFLGPALAAAGPDAATVMAGLQRRKLTIIMPLLGLITIASGMLMFNRISGGNPAALMQTPMGTALATAALATVVAFLIGVITIRPTMNRTLRLTEELATAQAEQRAVNGAEIQRLGQRGARLQMLVTILLVYALGAMAVARYL